MYFAKDLNDKLSEHVRVSEGGSFFLSIMIDQNKKDHQKADEKRTFSGISSHLISKFWSDWHFFNPWLLFERNFPLNFFEIKIVVEINLLFYFLLHIDKTDLFVSLSTSFNPHHNILPGIFSKIMEDRMFREVNELIIDLISVIWWDLNW